MAATDKYAGDLTQETPETLNGYEQVVMFDTNEGKRAYLLHLAQWIGSLTSSITQEEAVNGTSVDKRFVTPQSFKESTLAVMNEDDALLSSETITLWKNILGIEEE